MKKIILSLAVVLALFAFTAPAQAAGSQYVEKFGCPLSAGQDCPGIGNQTINVTPSYAWRLQILDGTNATSASNGTFIYSIQPSKGAPYTVNGTATTGLVQNGTDPFTTLRIQPTGLDANQSWRWVLELWYGVK